MDRDQGAEGPLITGLGPNGFRVGDRHAPSLLLTAERAMDWTPPALAELTIDDLREALSPHPEFVLIGTGAELRRPPAALVKALEALNVGLEPMDSRAAARAWGVLRAEGREVAAALYPLSA